MMWIITVLHFLPVVVSLLQQSDGHIGEVVSDGPTDKFQNLENMMKQMIAKQADLEKQIKISQATCKNEIEKLLTKQRFLENMQTLHKNEITYLSKKQRDLKKQLDQATSKNAVQRKDDSKIVKTNIITSSTEGGLNSPKRFESHMSTSGKDGPDIGNQAETHITKSKRLLLPVSEENGGRVAFPATFKNAVQDIGYNQHLEFNRVITNEGNGYLNNTGVFVCPSPGLYLFSVTILTFPDKWLEAEIVCNGQNMGNIYSYNDHHFGSGTNTVLFRLNVGDEVWVRVVKNLHNDGTVLHPTDSTFTGFKLYE